MSGKNKKRLLAVAVVALSVLAILVVRAAVVRSWLQQDFEAALAGRGAPGFLGEGRDAPAGESEDPTVARRLDEPADSVLELRLVTFNVWALPVALPGMDRRARLSVIPSRIVELSPTVVALQEAFDIDFRPFAVEYLGDAYQVWGEALCEQWALGFLRRDCSGGLLTLSRYPILSERAYPHARQEGMKLDERFSSKGFLVTTVSTPLGPVHVINIHLYAGREDADEAMRLRQLRRLQAVMDEEGLRDRPVLLMGDLNSVHPGVARADERYTTSEAYRFLTESLGFVETVSDFGAGDYTYGPETNRYADLWYNRVEGKQKLDYVLYRLPAGFRMRLMHHQVVLDDEPRLSDHHGFLVELELRAGI